MGSRPLQKSLGRLAGGLVLPALALGLHGCPEGCDGDDDDPGAGCISGQPPSYQEGLENASWECVGPEGGEVPLPGGGGRLVVPAGALGGPVTVVIREPVGPRGQTRFLRIEPFDVVLVAPAHLEIEVDGLAAGSIPPVAVFESGGDWLGGPRERTSWRPVPFEVRAADGLVDVTLEELGVVFADFEPANAANIVVDAPYRSLKPGDVVATLTKVDDEAGNSWRPGHLAMIECFDDPNRDVMIIDAARETGVCTQRADDLRASGMGLPMGAARPAGASYSDRLRELAVGWAAEQETARVGYVEIGDAIEDRLSSAGLVEGALDAADLGWYVAGGGHWGASPPQLFRALEPVRELDVRYAEAVFLPVYVLSLVQDASGAGVYRIGGTIEAEGLPPKATLERTLDDRWAIQWMPTREQIGLTFPITLRGTPDGGTGEATLEESLELRVTGHRAEVVVVPGDAIERGHAYELYYEVPQDDPDDTDVSLRLVDMATGLEPLSEPFPHHSFTVRHVGRHASRPNLYGITFQVRNETLDVVDAEAQTWLLTIDHRPAGWRGQGPCVPSTDCQPQVDVNSVGDAPDADLADGVCDTGATTASDEPECTLRAAIDQSNSREGQDRIRFVIPGSGVPTIAVGAALPVVMDPLIVDGFSQGDGGVTVDGTGAGEANGLVVMAEQVEVEGLTLQGFGGHGIHSVADTLTLRSVNVQRNCGWGVYATGHLRMHGRWADPAQVSDNGRGAGCQGGGVFASSGVSGQYVSLIGLAITGNGGPGVLVGGALDGGWLTVTGNDGSGLVLSENTGGTRAPMIRLMYGDSVFSDNGAHGIHAQAGSLWVSAPASLDAGDNGGWGIDVELGTVWIEHPWGRAVPQRIGGNGSSTSCAIWSIDGGVPAVHTMDCSGGGIFALGIGGHAGHSSLSWIDVSDNHGPGVLVGGCLTVQGLTASRNEGQGLAVARVEASQCPTETVLTIAGRPSFFSDNRSHGVHVEFGHLEVDAYGSIQAIGNDGWGVKVDDGRVALRTRFAEGPISAASDNGGVADCDVWSIDPDTECEVRGSGPCGGGGILAAGDWADNVLMKVTISDNVGPGVLARAPVDLWDDVLVSGNGGQGIAVIDPEPRGGGSIVGVDVSGPGNRIENNRGDGLYLDVGQVEVTGSLVVAGNAGWGARVRLGGFVASAAPPYAREVNGNGFGPSCRVWDLPVNGPDLFTVTEGPCDGGGLWLEEGDLSGLELDLRGNHAEGALVNGDVTLVGGSACLNGGEDVAATGTVDLDGVDQVCP